MKSFRRLATPALVAGVVLLAGCSAGTEAPQRPTPEAFRQSLVEHVASKPEDGRSWVLLARHDFERERFKEAAEEFEKALLNAKVARDPGVWCEHAEATALVQGGKLEGKPAASISRALAIQTNHPRALEMAGSLAVERKDYAEAARRWNELLVQLPAQSEERAQLMVAIRRVEMQLPR